MITTIYNNAGKVVCASINLRCVHRCNSRVRASHIEVRALHNGRAEFFIRWPDGAWASIEFASYSICVDHANSIL